MENEQSMYEWWEARQSIIEGNVEDAEDIMNKDLTHELDHYISLLNHDAPGELFDLGKERYNSYLWLQPIWPEKLINYESSPIMGHH